MRSTLILIAFSMLTLSGCSLTPELQRQNMMLPDNYRFATSLTSLAEQDWRAVFTDPQLQALIDEALSSGSDALLAAARVNEVEAIAGIARAPLFPQAVLSLKTSPTARLPGDELTSTYLGGVGINWELDFWGRYRSAAQAMRADILATSEAKHAVHASLVSGVAACYYQLAALHEMQSVTQRAVDNHRSVLVLIKRLSSAGIASAAEERQQESALATIEVRLPLLRRQVAETEHALAVLLGRNPSAFDLNAPVSLSLPEAIPAGLPSTLLQRRPDIREAEAKMVAANARIGEAKALFFPSLSLTAMFGGVTTGLTDLFSGNSATVASIGPDLMQPLFAGGRLQANREAVMARMEQAVINYRKTVLKALGEVADSLVAYETSLEVLNIQARRVDASTEVMRLADLRFRAGTAAFLEVLDAQRQSLSAEIDLTQSLLDRRLALIKVYKALGGGWQNEQ